MSMLTRFTGGLRALFRTSRVEAKLDDELRGFLAASVEERMRAGLTRAEAVRAARVQLGSIEAVKDRVRDGGWESILDGCWRDIQYGARMLRRTPGFTVVVVLLLALGIGANTAVFSVINTLMLRDLPVKQPERLVELVWQYPGDPRRNFFVSSVYEHFRDHNHVFSDVIGVSPVRFQLTRNGHDVETVEGQYVTGTFFPALGVQPAIGRLIAPDDDQVAAAGGGVAVISWACWQRLFNLDRSVLGSRVVLYGVEATVIGVTPRAFFGLQVGSSPDVWVPASMASFKPAANRTAPNRPPFMLLARAERRRVGRPGACGNAGAGSDETRGARGNKPRPAMASGGHPAPARTRGVLSAAGSVCAAADRTDGDRRSHVGDRVHQCRGSAAGARRVEAARDGGARRHRRGPRPHRPTSADRIAAAVHGGERNRHRPGVFRR
jgi:hypothetical protein